MTRPSEYEEWRLAFDVPEERVKASSLVDTLRSQLSPRVDVHQKGRTGIRVYAGTRADIDEALTVIEERFAVVHRARVDIALSRWNPGAERWQEPSLPIDPVSEPLPDPWSDLDEFAWEVRLRFDTDREMFRLLAQLREDGVAVLEGWKRCLVALRDETTARARAEELRRAAPRAAIEVRPLSRFRKWQIRQRVYGNYAKGADTGGPSSP